MSRPSVLIENWLPIAEVGVESMRERGASSALPPLYFLHVWWARRPADSQPGSYFSQCFTPMERGLAGRTSTKISD